MSKKLITAAAAATLGAIALSTQAVAGVTATAGATSDYIFRGLQSGETGGAAFASVDYAHDSGFAVGIWGIDNAGGLGINYFNYMPERQGQEFDIYASYTFEASDDLSLSIGYTSYQYTKDAGSVGEVNLGITFQKFSLAYDMGESDWADGASSLFGDEIESEHMALSYAHNDVWTFTVGQNDLNTDFDDEEILYLDIQAAGQVGDVDVALNLGAVDEGDVWGGSLFTPGYLTLTASKTFDGLGL